MALENYPDTADRDYVLDNRRTSRVAFLGPASKNIPYSLASVPSLKLKFLPMLNH